LLRSYETSVDAGAYLPAATALADAAQVRTRLLARSEESGAPTDLVASAEEVAALQYEQSRLVWYARLAGRWEEALSGARQCQDLLRARDYTTLLPKALAAVACWEALVRDFPRHDSRIAPEIPEAASRNLELCHRIAERAQASVGRVALTSPESSFALAWDEYGIKGDPMGGPVSEYTLHLVLGPANSSVVYTQTARYYALASNTTTGNIALRESPSAVTNRLLVSQDTRRRLYGSLGRLGILDLGCYPWAVLAPEMLERGKPQVVSFPGRILQPGERPRSGYLRTVLRTINGRSLINPGNYDTLQRTLTITLDGWQYLITDSDREDDNYDSTGPAARILDSLWKDIDALLPEQLASRYDVRDTLHPRNTPGGGPTTESEDRPRP